MWNRLKNHPISPSASLSVRSALVHGVSFWKASSSLGAVASRRRRLVQINDRMHVSLCLIVSCLPVYLHYTLIVP